MNIVYSTDNNYARHAGISIMSLCDHNREADEINIYIIDNGVQPENRKNLNEIAEAYGRKIYYIDFEKFKDRLILNNDSWELPISAYARLFVSEMLPSSLKRVIYLDCDILINDSIEDFWNTDLQGNTIAAVQDICYTVFRKETGNEIPYRYFCSGVILIDLNAWREKDCQNRMIQFVNDRNGVVRHHDQTILNGVFWDDCLIVHPRYDVLTPLFIMSYKNLTAYFKCEKDFYREDEIREAVRHPAIIHFTSSNIGRPWENKAHPLSKLYRKYWKKSAWKDVPMGTFKPTYDAVQRRTYWLYQHIPVEMIRLIASK